MTGPGEPDRFRWRVPLYAVALMFVAISVLELVEGYDAGLFGGIGLELFFCFITFCALLIPLANRKYRLATSVLRVIPATLLGGVLGLGLSTLIRSDVRWLFVANGYKNDVLRQPETTDGMLRHVEWDGWGFAGNDTTEYLVFDPADSLPHRNTGSGRFKGIPCEVPRVHRLEPHWYVVLFYTDTAWNYCGP